MTHIANALQELEAAHTLGEDPPYDTLDHALWRVRFILRAFYDAPADQDPDDEVDDTPLKDLLTDLVHYAESIDVDIEDVLERAKWMATEDLKDWGVEA
jgi:hypothetical protein